MMRAAMMIAVLVIELLSGSMIEAQPLTPSVERESLYGLPFNRPPYYRRGPRPPAVREHERYYRPGKRKVHRPFERESYWMSPAAPALSGLTVDPENFDADEQSFWDKFRDSVMKDKPAPAEPPKVVDRKPVDPPKESEKPKEVERRALTVKADFKLFSPDGSF